MAGRTLHKKPSLLDYKPVARIAAIQPPWPGSSAAYVLAAATAEARMTHDDLSRQLQQLREKNQRLLKQAERRRSQGASAAAHLRLAVTLAVLNDRAPAVLGAAALLGAAARRCSVVAVPVVRAVVGGPTVDLLHDVDLAEVGPVG